MVASTAAPIATHAALAGATLDAAFNQFDNAGGGTHRRGSSVSPLHSSAVQCRVGNQVGHIDTGGVCRTVEQ